jgi:hypothetical protein
MWGVRCCRRDKKICRSDERSESAGPAHPATRQFRGVFQISKYAAAIAAAAIPVTKANISWSPIPLYVTTTQYGRIMVNGRLPASRSRTM